jgi:hypothetical protein
MSDASSGAIRDTRRDWVVEHREMYLRSGGAQGHIMDITMVGGRNFATHCLIKYTGRKSGKIFITPLCYADIGGEVVVCGSKGGADTHPAWYLNIQDSAEIEFKSLPRRFARRGVNRRVPSVRRFGLSCKTASRSTRRISWRPTACCRW